MMSSPKSNSASLSVPSCAEQGSRPGCSSANAGSNPHQQQAQAVATLKDIESPGHGLSISRDATIKRSHAAVDDINVHMKDLAASLAARPRAGVIHWSELGFDGKTVRRVRHTQAPVVDEARLERLLRSKTPERDPSPPARKHSRIEPQFNTGRPAEKPEMFKLVYDPFGDE